MIWKLHLQGKPTQNIDYSMFVQKSKGFSGADILGVVDVTIETILSEVTVTGKMIPITTRSLLQNHAKNVPQYD